MGNDAFAQVGGTGPQGGPSLAMLLNMLPILLIFVIFYFLLIRPQQQRQKKLSQMLQTLKKGDRVLTSSGIFGTVVGVDDAKAVLRIADDVKVEFLKSSVVQVMAEDAS
jgi:preprotein translocase subunit YajC